MEDPGLWDEEPVLSRRERLRREREAAHQRPVRTRLRITAAAALVAALLAWLLVSWGTSSPSSSEPLPEPPELSGSDDGGSRPRETPPDGTAPAETPDEAADGEGDSTGGPGEEEAPVLVVHVAGAVKEPGVVELPSGSRIHDALEAAGGAVDGAALEALNLAAEAVDGSLIHVPTREEVDAGGPPPIWPQDGAGQDPAGQDPSDGFPWDGAEETPVNLNEADAGQLEQLPGIGPALAERIVDHRSDQGPFGSLEELAGVRGIGPAILEDIADQVTW
ncbi:ComEA family DNA-binding protein [Nesterenkonia sp. HG001]|uniref:ComEA family DNA-binding protein n=1 Tax=Nesterenkonia sp. HG001 TaxID=2983207 RepID=UPI002AC44689|nr:ComEA family DNA-binding protein [Nesterenkonia sp. HG001]MDZ5077910.1 helix-hairpin-helix domain-containing protein [Nesterenkonia sp. HG001]